MRVPATSDDASDRPEGKPMTIDEIAGIADELETASSTEILRWALARFSGSIVAACSFGGPSGMVLLDQLVSLDRSIPIFYIDTGLLHAETHEHCQRVAERYGIAPLVVCAAVSLAEQNERYGDRLWERDPDRCCEIRKVDAQRNFLVGYRAWISGIRRDQTPTRARARVVEWDEAFDIVKINPLARWSDQEIWRYIQERNVPYNALHDRGYASIGCVPCTKPSVAGDPRSGRWPGHLKTECGIHGR